MFEEFLSRAGGAEGIHAYEDAIGPDETVPAHANAGFDGNLDLRIPQDRCLVVVVLIFEEFEARNRNDARGDALGFELFAGFNGERDFRARGEDRDVRIA